MPQIELNDQVFQAAERRAADRGYSNVAEYIAGVVVDDLSGADHDFDHVFTPERAAELERISADVKGGGKTYSMSEVHEHFEGRRRAWLENHAT